MVPRGGVQAALLPQPRPYTRDLRLNLPPVIVPHGPTMRRSPAQNGSYSRRSTRRGRRVAGGIGFTFSHWKLPLYPNNFPQRLFETLTRIRKHCDASSNHSHTSAVPEKKHRETEGDRALVKALFCRANLEVRLLRNTYLQVYCQMLVRAKVVHNAPASLTPNHVCIETSLAACMKCPYPGHGLSSYRVQIGIVLDGKRYLRSFLRKHIDRQVPT